MSDEGTQSEDATEPSLLPDLAPLPTASEELARADLQPTLLPELADDHKRRYHEAWVKEHEIRAKQADDDRAMRKDIAGRVFQAIRIQVVIADIAFLTYGFWNHWKIPGSTISAWLGAVVVQVIAVGLVIARSLFPQRPFKR
jgi:hypothetical protein